MSPTGFHPRPRPRRWPSGGSQGFSLLEMLIVVGVLGLVAAIFVPNFLSLLRQIRLTSAANRISSLVQQTRVRAIKDGASYTVGVSGAEVVGRGLLNSGLDTTNDISIELSDLNDVAIFPPGPPGETSPADCLDNYNPAVANYAGDSVTYDSLGVASGTLAICVSDAFGNVLQIALDNPRMGQPKIRKYLPAVDSPAGEGFFENLSAATAGTTWTWY